jgi:hypothetical protein
MSFGRVRLIALFCLPSAALAQPKFEGVVTARMASLAGRGGTATYSVKGERLRMDMTGATGITVTMLRDPSKSLDVMLMHQQKMVMDVSTMQGRGAAAVESKKPKMKMTGKKEAIAGRECEHVLVTSDDGGQLDVCLAKGMGSFIMGGSMGGRGKAGDASSEVLSRLGTDAFPLKVRDVKRGVTVFEVTKIEKKGLADALFVIPDGYQKIDMGRLGRPGL